MANKPSLTLAVPTSVTAGDALEVGRFDRFTVYITATAVTATIDIQVSHNGSSWITVATVTAASATVVDLDANYVRTNVTAYTSSTALAGRVVGKPR